MLTSQYDGTHSGKESRLAKAGESSHTFMFGNTM